MIGGAGRLRQQVSIGERMAIGNVADAILVLAEDAGVIGEERR